MFQYSYLFCWLLIEMSYQIAKGVFDILPEDPDPKGNWRSSSYWQHVEKVIREISEEFGFEEIRTPLFEKSELFTRSIGATSDIVTKEMYTFLDKGGRSMTLRPEGTAPVMRSFIEKKLHLQKPVSKFYYLFPMFRYERQQAGRYRQHHQFGVEAIGIASPYQDAEVIILLYSFLKRLGIQGLTLHLNSIGDESCRELYRLQLQNILRPHLQELSPESALRFESNPLRILDSKDPKDQQFLTKVPSIMDFLGKEERTHFETLCHLLSIEGVPFHINPKLVRGLDYYNRTVFEVTSKELGAQDSLGGGGRYDSLIESLGGPSIPSVGFGAGLERIIQTMLAQHAFLPSPSPTKLYLIPLGEEAKEKCFELLCNLREKRIPAQMDFSDKKLKNAMRIADSIKAQYVAIIGEEELKSGQIVLKEMKTGQTETHSIDQITEIFKHV